MKTVNCGFIAGALLALIATAQGAEPGLSERFYNAIRVDDTQAVRRLLESGADINTKDTRGATPLMYAAAVGTPAMLRQLIAAGAEVNARNGFESTALMWCANDPEKIRLLIENGADVNARSKRGRTPLLVAAAHSRNQEVIGLLLKAGAALPQGGDFESGSLLASAAAANDAEVTKLLLARGLDPNSKDAGGFTALVYAAAHGNVELVKHLMARGADVNAQTAPNGHRVKHGPIAIGRLTPLLVSVASGSVETVRLLLEAGADVNATDVRGMTPLMLAVATDRSNEEIVRLLLAKRPVAGVKSKAGETALAWAAKFRHPTLLPAIQAVSGEVESPKATPAVIRRAQSGTIQTAGAQSVALLQKTTAEFFKQSGCISCHSQNITTMAVAAARENGIPVDTAAAAEVSRATRLQFAAFADGLLERLDPPAVDILTYSLAALAAEGAQADRITDAMVHNVAAQQRADGSWGFPGIMRPPTADGGFTTTAMAIRGLQQYTPPARRKEMQRRIAAGARWLLSTTPRTTEDAVMQLLGAKWAGTDAQTIRRMARKIMALQREDGGWSQTPNLTSDAYATGTALYALKLAGRLPASDGAYRKGVAYLLETQAEDGSWYVASRTPKFQPYFEGGFPYHHDQWISQMATGWATMALALAEPQHRPGGGQKLAQNRQ